MSFVKVKFRIINPVEKEKFIDVEGFVDTGAIYTVVDRVLLESIGLNLLKEGNLGLLEEMCKEILELLKLN
jgi:predicted aspartyl protease